jgi:hypothetical protein
MYKEGGGCTACPAVGQNCDDGLCVGFCVTFISGFIAVTGFRPVDPPSCYRCPLTKIKKIYVLRSIDLAFLSITTACVKHRTYSM